MGRDLSGREPENLEEYLMKNYDTPRVNEMLIKLGFPESKSQFAELARQLERELNEAIGSPSGPTHQGSTEIAQSVAHSSQESESYRVKM